MESFVKHWTSPKNEYGNRACYLDLKERKKKEAFEEALRNFIKIEFEEFLNL